MGKEEEDVDIVSGVCPLTITSAPELVEEEDEYMDICGKASPVKNLDEDAIIINSPISSRSDSNSNSTCDCSSGGFDSNSSSDCSSSYSDESIDNTAPAERTRTDRPW